MSSVVRIRISARYSSLFLVDLLLHASDHLVGHDAAARAQDRHTILDDEGVVTPLLLMGIPAQDAPPSKVGQDLAGCLALSFGQLLGGMENVFIDVEVVRMHQMLLHLM
jgi:hypothetical protein